jgi:glycosyltransferase involved in cell wall biosynthesis
MFNGWLAIMGPSGTTGLVDRQLSQVLCCAYMPYSAWLCQHCYRYLRSNELQAHPLPAGAKYRPIGTPVQWLHTPCVHYGPIRINWDDEPTVTVILYAYHSYCCDRPEAHDDIRKLLMMGKKVIILAHDLNGLERIASHVHGVLCPSPEGETALRAAMTKTGNNVRATATAPHATPMMPVSETAPIVKAEHIVGWHGLWRPDRNVHILITAIAKLYNDGLDIGLLAQGGLVQPGLRPLPSSLAYYNYCIKVANSLNLGDRCHLSCPVRTRDNPGYDCWADVHATLRQCTLFCLPTDQRDPTKRSAAAQTCLFFQRPTVISAIPFHHDALEGAIPLEDLSVDGIAARLAGVINGTIVPPEHAALKISAIHQPFSIQHRYLTTIRNWVA